MKNDKLIKCGLFLGVSITAGLIYIGLNTNVPLSVNEHAQKQNVNLENELLKAIAQKDSKKIKELLEKGVDINFQAPNKQTPLFLAIEKGDFTISQNLIEKGASLSQINNEGYTPLLLAIKSNQPDIAYLILMKSQDISYVSPKGETATSLAHEKGWGDIEKVLSIKQSFIKQSGNEKKANLTDSFSFGVKESKNILVEYIDWHCEYCLESFAELEKAAKTQDVLIFIKQIPDTNNPISLETAIAFEALAKQDKTKAIQFASEVLKKQKELNSKTISPKDIYSTIDGVDSKQLSEDMSSDVIKNRIKRDYEEFKSFNFKGVPTLLVNNIPFEGKITSEQFNTIIKIK